MQSPEFNIDYRDLRNTFSYGLELELSDIDRTVDIPEHLGYWEGPKEKGYWVGAELDIVNTMGHNYGLAIDPVCSNCKVGGEINTQPTIGIDRTLHRVLEILDLFKYKSVGPVNHGHIHIYLPELDLAVTSEELVVSNLKNLLTYNKNNEKFTVEIAYDWNETIARKADLSDYAYDYMKNDGARYLNSKVYTELEACKSLEDIKRLLEYKSLRRLKDNSTVESTSVRTAVNFSNLIKNKTIEFRCFRASIDPFEIASQLVFVTRWLQEGLQGEKGVPVARWTMDYNLTFPKVHWREDLIKSWEKTKSHRDGPGSMYKYWPKNFYVNDTSNNKYVGEVSSTLAKILEPKSLDIGLCPTGWFDAFGVSDSNLEEEKNFFEELKNKINKTDKEQQLCAFLEDLFECPLQTRQDTVTYSIIDLKTEKNVGFVRFKFEVHSYPINKEISKYTRLIALYVLPEYRSQSLGATLYKIFYDLSKKAAYRVERIRSYINKESVDFYLRWGYFKEIHLHEFNSKYYLLDCDIDAWELGEPNTTT